MSKDEELALIKRAKNGDKDATEELLESHKGLVVYCANKMIKFEKDDMIQAGMEGIIRAIKGFDPERGMRFSTYAVWWIKEFQRKAGVAICGLPKNYKYQKMAENQGYLHLDDFHDPDNILVSKIESPEEKVLRKERSHKVLECLLMLSPKERWIIENYFLNEVIHEDMVPHFGFSRQRVHQIHQKALEKIKVYFKIRGVSPCG
jgi:RNA polymerase sigma factor (sigma-70 family)